MFNNDYDKYPFFEYKFDSYPTKQQQLNFLKGYKENMKNNMINLDDEHLILESNYFALASHLFWSYWAVCQACTSQAENSFQYMVIYLHH